MAAGNVIFGGIIGLGVDAASGAMNKYPDVVTVAMTPDPACRAPEPAPPNRGPPRHISTRSFSGPPRARRRGHFQRLALVTSSAMRFAPSAST
jgi:hypothetical protein